MSAALSSLLDSDESAYMIVIRIADGIFADMQRDGAMSDDDMSALSFLFGSTFAKALPIVDAQSVSMILAAPSNRYIFTVSGSEPLPYHCTLHHCSCPAFHNAVVTDANAVYCKHQLAVRIAAATKTHKVKAVSDAELTALLQAQSRRRSSAAH